MPAGAGRAGANERPPPATLMLGWGNPARGDDGLGPALVETLQAEAGARDDIEWLIVHQLEPELTLDLAGRARVLLVDASEDAAPPFDVAPVAPARDAMPGTHAMGPPALLRAYELVHAAPPPPCVLLAIRGESFDLGETLSEAGARNLRAASAWAKDWLAR
jgi:hydrogenase maturation protease